MMNGPPPSTNVQDVRVVVTPSPSSPNVIPVGGRSPNQHQHATIVPYQQQPQQQQHQHQQHQHQHQHQGTIR